MYWKFGNNIMVNGGAYINLNEEVRERREDVIKLFTDEELKEEIHKREQLKSKYKFHISELDTYISDIDVDVCAYDVLNEIDNDELIDEVLTRNLKITDNDIEGSKYDLRRIICETLGINEMYDDEEFFDMLREIWMIKR